MAQDAQQLPTWGQHGANMGPTWGPRKAPKSVQGAKNLVPTGSEARTPAKSRHGPQIDPKMDPKRTPICFQNGPHIDSKWSQKSIPHRPSIHSKSALKLTSKSTSCSPSSYPPAPLGAKLKRLFHHLSGVCSSGLRSFDCLDSLVLGC